MYAWAGRGRSVAQLVATLALAGAASCDDDSSNDGVCDSRRTMGSRDVAPGTRRVDLLVRVGDGLSEDERFVFGELNWTFARASADPCRVGLYRGGTSLLEVPDATPDQALPPSAGASTLFFEGVLPPADDPAVPYAIGIGWVDDRSGPTEDEALVTPETTSDIWLTSVFSCDGLRTQWLLREYHYRCPTAFEAQLSLEPQ
jgi:hypothetical protein